MSSPSKLSPPSYASAVGSEPSNGLSVGVPAVGFGPTASSSPSDSTSTPATRYSGAEKLDEVQENPSNPILLSDQQEKPPVDSFRIVYMVALILGFTQLIPWNCFSMCQQYFTEYKLNTNTSTKPWYRENFMSYLANTSMLCTLTFVALNLLATFSFSKKDAASTANSSSSSNKASPLGWRARMCGCGRDPRIFYALIVMFVVFSAHAFSAMVNTSGWPIGFFWFIIGTCALVSFCGGLISSNSFGIFAQLPPAYSNGLVLGNNVCGSLVAVVNLLSQMSTPNPELAAFVYFLAALFCILVAFVSFWALPHMNFYRYFAFRAVESQQKNNNLTEGETTCAEQNAAATAEALKNPDPTVKLVVPSAPNEEADRELVIFGLRLPPYHIIIPQTWKHLLAVWCVFFATLAIYPTVQIGITPAQFTNQENFLVKYWISIVVFLLFNVTAMLGNFLAWFDWFVKLPCCRSNVYWIMAVIRVFVSMFFFLFLCNYLPETRTLRIYFSHDILFLIGAIIFGLTSGAFSSLAMMYAPRAVKDPRDAPTAAMLAAFCLTFGLFCGAMFSFVLKSIVHIGVKA